MAGSCLEGSSAIPFDVRSQARILDGLRQNFDGTPEGLTDPPLGCDETCEIHLRADRVRRIGLITSSVLSAGQRGDDDAGRPGRPCHQPGALRRGTAFGDVIDGMRLPAAEPRTSRLYRLSQTIDTIPSLYLEAGAIHGAVLCRQDEPRIYTEDVGRHNMVDKIAACMHRNGIAGGDRISTPPATSHRR